MQHPTTAPETDSPLGVTTSRELANLLIIAVVVGLASLVLHPVFVMKILCFALFACAYNLVFGYGGLLAFGHAAFFGSASYATAYAMKVWQFTPEVAMALGVCAAAVLGVIIGWFAIKRQGLYFAMITLALAQIVYFYAVQARWTRGEDGIQTGPRGALFGIIDLNYTPAMYIFALVVFLFGFAVVYRTIHSPFGQALRAVRENEARVISLGYYPDRLKLQAFVLSAALSGLAGGLKCIVFQLASLDDVLFTTSGDALLMTLIGGVGTVWGPVFGAVVLVAMLNYLASFGAWVEVVQGAMFVTCVLVFRTGVVGMTHTMVTSALASRLLERKAQK